VLVAEVTFLTWTGEGLLRQVVFQGLREDKSAEELEAEKPVKPKNAELAEPRTGGGAARSSKDSGKGKPLVLGVLISHPEKTCGPTPALGGPRGFAADPEGDRPSALDRRAAEIS
jgi:bifunctional non-homologous end joining protein LigD